MGQFDTEGFSEGWLLGAVLIEGDSDGIDDGCPDREGCKLGFELG